MSQLALPETAYAAQLQDGFRKLRFLPVLEAEFREDFASRHLLRIRLGFGIALVLYAAYALLRLRFESGAPAEAATMLRGSVLVALTLTLAFTAHARLRALLPFVTVPAYAIVAAALAGLEVVARRHGLDYRYEGLVLASFHLYAFGGLLMRQALVGGALMIVLYVGVGWAGGLASQAWAYQLLFIALTHVVGATALYSVEHIERESFLRRNMLGVMATRDVLTGLFNRLAFFQQSGSRTAQAARDGRAIGVVLLDVDHFKKFNDHYGHLDGDACLRAVAAALAQEFRRPSDMVARYGGEEFVGFWYDIQPQALRPLAEQIRGAVQALKIPHEAAPGGRVTVSVGAVACVPGEDESLAELIERADKLLYQAKSRGRNRVVVETLARVATPQSAAGRRAPSL